MPPTPPAIAAWVRCVKAGLEEQDPALLYQAFMTNVDRIFKQRPYPALHLETRRLNYKGPNDFEGIVSGEMGSDSKVQMCRALQAYLWLMESADPNIMSHIRPGFQQQTKMFFERMKEFMQWVYHPPNAINKMADEQGTGRSTWLLEILMPRFSRVLF